MNRYEMLLLAEPGITGDECSLLERNFEKLVQESKGNVISFDKWGKCRLSYPVRHHDYGVYFLARFEVDPSSNFFSQIRTLFTIKYNNLIMRSNVVVLPANKKFADFRPQTVEDTPRRNVDEFLKENKMEGLLRSSDDAHDDHMEDEAGL